MAISTASVAEPSAWDALAAHHRQIKGVHMRELFAKDPKRGERFAVEAAGIYLDYSKNRITDDTLNLLVQLAEEAGLRARIAAMFGGEKINASEKRAVLHIALRAPKGQSILVDGDNVVPGVHAVLERMADSGYFRNLPSDDAFFLQNMLEGAGRWAIASKDLPEANRIHSGAVAFESTLSLLSALGYRGEESRARQTPVYKTLNAMAFDAGKEFYTEGGTGASAAPVVALRHAGDLLAALHPEAKRDWTAYALSLSQRATIEDVDAVREKLFGGTSSNGTTGEAWREKMGERYKDDAWFVGHVTGRDPKDASKSVAQYPTAAENKAKGLAALTEAERRDFATILFAANVTWKSGQAYRGRNDLTRTDSALRDGVYDTYENLIRIDDDPERANYVVLKDAWELREKGQKLLEGK
jgi:predicted nucleic acid-binding protein